LRSRSGTWTRRCSSSGGSSHSNCREGLEVARSVPGGTLDFRDPWGNLIQVVDYRDVQFERTPGVKRALGIEDVAKGESALREIREKGLG
jgi:hypothetical protein